MGQGDRPKEIRRRLRATETGIWLNAIPSSLNGTILTADEFRDSTRIRLGLPLLHLPPSCDGCGEPFGLAHSQICKKGGLVTLRHEDLKAEFTSLLSSAFTPGAVRDEPLIHTYRGPGAAAAGSEAELRGDIATHGFWRRGMTTIFNVRISDTDAASYSGLDPRKVLARQEKSKKEKYGPPCADRRRHFTPLVFSVDGLLGDEAQAASKRLARALSVKWKRSYSELCGYVRSRLSLALVRSTSMLLRNPRESAARNCAPSWETGAGLALYD
jgi:hypothetical protein